MKTRSDFTRKMLWQAARIGTGLLIAFTLPARPAATEAPPKLGHYTLLPASSLIDDCPPCARPTILEPMRGTFDLRLVEKDPLFSRYELTNIMFTAGSIAGRTYKVVGRGSYTVGGEVALRQDMFLEVQIDDGFTNRLCYLTNATPILSRRWPLLDVELVQTNGTFTQVYDLHLLAAPMRDLWFSTANGLTSSNWNPPTNHVSGGDLLSFGGTVQKRNQELTAQLGMLPGVPDPGLDAVTVSSNGEILFSLERDAFSDVHGWLQHGDLVSDTGRLVRRNQALYAAFSPMPSPAPPDLGLDAVQVLDSGETYFSIEDNIFSERLGVLLRRGDLLSDRGVVVRTHDALLARFHPPPTLRDYGLDAIHVWSSGEIWFSLEEGFQDDQLGPIQPGDLLSDEGSIVFRNRELVNPFSPLEDLADFGLDALAVIASPLPAPAPLPPPPAWNYTLLEGSQLTDDCLVCDRIPIVVPMRGGFQLRSVEENPLFSRYAVQNISFTAGIPLGRTYKVTGHGTYRVGGEVALVQEMFLELLIDDGVTSKPCYLTNDTGGVDRLWPMIKIHLDQTNGTLLQTYRLDLAAAPLQEIWFSTGHGFHPGVQAPYTNYITAGDLVSSAGRVVKRNEALTTRLGFMPAVPDLGLDAVDILPGGEIAFSMEQDMFSESLGPLHEGDVLSNRGRILHHYAELIGAFSPEPPPADQGLDALHAAGSASAANEIVFSIERDFFSETLGRMIRRGDLLSSRGVIIKTNEQLVAHFNPADPKKDYGLDAVWVWPSGEVWFSTEDTFHGQHFESYNPGDILSDQGYVVYRNLELLNAFAPLEDLGDFGLDAMFIVTDAAPPLPASRFIRIQRQAATDTVELQWDGKGRVFQVQRARDVTGPYQSVSDIVPDLFFNAAGSTAPQSFYRLRQW